MKEELTTHNDWQTLLIAAERGDADAQLEVGFQYGSGIIINGIVTSQPDEKLEFEWVKRAYENGNTEAIEYYAYHLSNGKYCDKDLTLAMKLYKKAIKMGSSSAAHNLGVEYSNKHKYKMAFSLYRKAHTNLSADFSLGMCYYYGIGVQKNKLKALRFFKGILKEGYYLSGYESNEANYMIGKIYLEGEVVKRSIAKARHYLLLANEDGDHNSANEILMVIGYH